MSTETITQVEERSLIGAHEPYKTTEEGFGTAYIDIDEWRDRPRRHRYIHGGFEDTHTRFSFYFPPDATYCGRFLKYLEGGAGGHEVLLSTAPPEREGRPRGGHPESQGGAWIFDLVFDDLDGYLLESNQGHFEGEGNGFTNEVDLFAGSAECARFSKYVAKLIYGKEPHHGYVFGGSGGGSRSFYCLENRPDVFAGGVPHVITSGGLSQQWSAVGYWWLHARHKIADIIDAVEPGGGGDPFATLSNDQREALAGIYRQGYPRGAETLLWCFAPWLWQIVVADVTPYYREFWSKPGFLGHDNPKSIEHLVVNEKATIGTVFRTSQMAEESMWARVATQGASTDQDFGVTLAKDLADNTALFGCKLTFLTGKAKGRSVYVTSLVGSLKAGTKLTTSVEMHPELFDGVAAGDEVQVDNRDFVAWCHIHRYMTDLDQYSIPDGYGGQRIAPEFGGMRAWAVDGKPLYPQIPTVVNNGTQHTGRFTGKMIHLNATLDSMVWPTGVAAYERKARNYHGDALGDHYRLWWVENAPHGEPESTGTAFTLETNPGVWRSRMVDYSGATAQAVRDVVRWVEEGVAPTPSTNYRFTDDGGLILPDTAAERGGVQPVVRASANGASKAEVKVGETVRFQGLAEQPPGQGAIVWADWDFDGLGKAGFEASVDGGQPRVEVNAAHAYQAPGTYFASFRVGAHRDGKKGRGLAVENLARVRVVVGA